MKQTRMPFMIVATMAVALAALTGLGPARPAAAQSGPRAGLALGEPACVAAMGLNLRLTPGYLTKAPTDVLAELPRGTSLTLTGGPVGRDGSAWWFAEAGAGIQGWVAEWSSTGRPLLTAGPCAALSPATGPTAPAKLGYLVRAGDTLGQLADRYGTTVVDIMRANGLADSSLAVGQFLWLPPASVMSARQMRLLGDVQWVAPASGSVQLLQAGVASWAVWTMGAQVEYATGLPATPASLVPGTTIEVIGGYAGPGTISAARIYLVDHRAAALASPPSQWPYAEQPPGPAGLPLVHRVMPGDTLYRLAAQYRTTVEAIRRANGMPAWDSTIRVYQTLLIPR